jgi:two-component system, NarL family, nitrate/nitrite response regulator NarL
MPSPAEQQSIKVFLVEDHKCVLWGLEKLVNSEPQMRVVGTAQSGEQALAGIRQAEPDVVLLDLDLGGDSSLGFLPEILQQPGLGVVILTGSRDKAMLERAVVLGAGGIVLKDAPAEVVLEAVRRVHRGELWIDRNMMARVLGTFIGNGGADSDAARNVDPLTPKEQQIVRAIVEQRGANSNVIAANLFMSGHTLRNHLTTIYRKLDVKNRLELVMYAIEHRLSAADAPAAARKKRLPVR